MPSPFGPIRTSAMPSLIAASFLAGVNAANFLNGTSKMPPIASVAYSVVWLTKA